MSPNSTTTSRPIPTSKSDSTSNNNTGSSAGTTPEQVNGDPDWSSLEHPDHFDSSESDESGNPLPHTPHSHTQPHAHTVARVGEGVVAVTQADMYTHVFVPIEERDPPVLDIKYVVGVVTEYIRSLNFHHVAVTPPLYELLIDFLVRNNKWYQLHQFLQYHVVSDSTHVAGKLLSLEGK